MKFISRLYILHDGSLILGEPKTKNTRKIICTQKSFINLQLLEISYYQTSNPELLIMAQLEDTIYENYYSIHSSDVEFLINHCINDYLKVEDKKLSVKYSYNNANKELKFQVEFCKSAKAVYEIKIFEVVAKENICMSFLGKKEKYLTFFI
jgi:hypothetical protein